MPSGVPIDRQWVFVLEDGSPVVDWGDDLMQDLLSGDFLESNRKDPGHIYTLYPNARDRQSNKNTPLIV